VSKFEAEQSPLLDSMAGRSSEAKENIEVIGVRKLGNKNKPKIDISVKPTEQYQSVPKLYKIGDKSIKKVVAMPSKNITYPIETEGLIFFESYFWAEVKKLNQDELPSELLWDFILEGINTPFDKNLLTIPDFFYLALLRRLETVGMTKFQVNIKCYNFLKDDDGDYIGKTNSKGKFVPVKCNEMNSYIIEDGEINYDDIRLTREQLPIIIPINDEKYHFTPMTIADAKALLEKDLYDDEIARLAIQCRNKTFEEAYEVFKSRNVSFEDGSPLDELEDIFYHRLLPINRVCGNPNCKQDIKIQLDGGGIIIMPFRESGYNVRDRIIFGFQGKSAIHDDRQDGL
jgi:hypothetical protein